MVHHTVVPGVDSSSIMPAITATFSDSFFRVLFSVEKEHRLHKEQSRESKTFTTGRARE